MHTTLHHILLLLVSTWRTVHLLLFYTSDLLTFLVSGQAGEPGAYATTVLLPFLPLTSGLWFSIPCSICRGDPGWLLRWLDSVGCLLLLVALSVRYVTLGRSATLSDATVEISQHVSNT